MPEPDVAWNPCSPSESMFTIPGIRVHDALEWMFTFGWNLRSRCPGIRNFTGESFWARGYFVSTVGLDEVVVREYIRNQEKEDRRLEQLNLDWSSKEPD